MTINELARMYLSLQVEEVTGYVPYDRRKYYEVGDKIIVKGGGGLHPAEVIYVDKGNSDSDGFAYDKIELLFLDKQAILSGNFHGSYISNYEGIKYAGPVVESYGIISEEDESHVIPKILQVLSGDEQIVSFMDNWMLRDSITSNISNKITNIVKSIAKQRQPLTTRRIVEETYGGDVSDRQLDRLVFSVNYFLERDKRLVLVPDEETKWDIDKPHSPIHVPNIKECISGGKFSIPSVLEKMLLYNGFVEECLFELPEDQVIKTYYNMSEGHILGSNFFDELNSLVEEETCVVEFKHPEQRGEPIEINVLPPDHLIGVKSTVTIKDEWLESNVLLVPPKLSRYINKTEAIYVLYDQVEQQLSYDKNEKLIRGLDSFYLQKAIEEGDKVHIQLESLKPPRIHLSTSWKKSYDTLLKIQPEVLDWKDSPLRDCIIVTLANLSEPVHYRTIYSEIAIHKVITIGSIIGCLSRFTPSVFVHTGAGLWQLAVKELVVKHPKGGGGNGPEPPISIGEETWKAVRIIENEDYVYKLLDKIKKPLSYDDICAMLAENLKIDIEELKKTGFLEANDERLRRLDDGTWALVEWFDQDDTQEEDKSNGRVREIPLAILLFIIIAFALILLKILQN